MSTAPIIAASGGRPRPAGAARRSGLAAGQVAVAVRADGDEERVAE